MNSKLWMIRVSAVGALVIALTAGCGDPRRGESTATTTAGGASNPTTNTTGGAALSFASDVHPILMAICSGCHNATNGTAYKLTGDPATDYTTVLGLIKVGDATGSKLIQKSTAAVTHGGGQQLKSGTADENTVTAWINDGANP